MSDLQATPPTPATPAVAPGAAALLKAPILREHHRKLNGTSIRRISRHMRSIRLVLQTMLFLAIIYTVTIGKPLLIPLLLAGFIGLGLNPIVSFGARLGVPRWLSACVVMLALGGAVGGGTSMLAPAALNWFHQAPEAMRQLAPKIKPMTQQLEAASRATQNLVGGNPRAGQPAPVAVFSSWDVITGAPKVMASVLTVALLVFFFLIYGDELLRRAVEVSPTFAQKRHTVSIVRSIQSEVSRYLLTTMAINAGLGLITAAMLYGYGVPDPLLWGAVAMLFNFVPYVGAITTTVVLCLVGLLHFNDAGTAMLPALSFAAITAIEGNVITPLIQGRRMRLSPVAILLWLLVWGWLWGIPGALLAVPMLTSAKLVAGRLRGWEWFAMMVGR
ncbi:AI-2E family transporter [Pinirhizobacter sp.]|jgi:predicted PurR-regulated permease PerM|uniref:AI-2E family transporter n=1 Tax=Pinirhizobacter sp. TaxID=2950432 RepID=UPI002F4166C3